MTSPSLSQKDVAELRRLLEKATRGPWQSHGATFDAVSGPQIHGCCHFEEITMRQAADNCAMIAALHNAAPALLALASQSLEREVEVRREERERCAKVAEQAVVEWKNFDGTVQAIEKIKNREIIAKAIRALSQQPDKEG